MANFGGFDVQTPQEVLGRLNQARQEAASSRNENIVFNLTNMFSADLWKARKIEDNMRAAQNTFDETTTAKPGSLDYEAERLSAMYQAVKDFDPVAGAQIASQLTQIDEARFERERLSAQDRRAEDANTRANETTAITNDKNRRLNLQDNTTYIETTDPTTGRRSYEAYNLGDPDSRLAFEKARMKDGTVVLTRSEMADRNAPADDADMALHNKSTFSTKLETLQAAEHSLRQGARIVSILAANPDANTSFTDILDETNDVLQSGKAALAKAAEVAGYAGPNDNVNMSKVQGVLNGIEWYTDMDAEDRAAVEALTLNMAYVLARSLDPSGRLSDADVMFAGRMMAASNGDPRTLARAMTEQVVSNADKWRRAERRDLDVLTPEQRRNSTQARRLDAVLNGLDAGIAGYQDLLVNQYGIVDEEQFNNILTPFSFQGDRSGTQDRIENPARTAPHQDEDFGGITID